MNIRKLLVAAAAAAAFPAVFAQAGPGPLRGEAWYLPSAPAQLRPAPEPGANAAVMPEYDFVAGELGYVPHQHQFMEQNELKARAMGNFGVAPEAGATRVQGPAEIELYLKAGG